MNYRNTITNEIVPGHKIGETSHGTPLYLAMPGYEPVTGYETDADGHWLSGDDCVCVPLCADMGPDGCAGLCDYCDRMAADL